MKKGFTIVELLIVIVVIAILATLTTIGYRTWRIDTVKATTESDLKMAASAMEQARNFNNSYPMSLPPAYKGNTHINVYAYGETFCLEAERDFGEMHIWSNEQSVKDGGC